MIFQKRQSSEYNQMGYAEQYLMGGEGQGSLNAQFGPSRTLERAPKFSFLDTKAAWEEASPVESADKDDKYSSIFEFETRTQA